MHNPTQTMPPPLKVIALISGGKDSLFSILHCISNGHDVVALASLYPARSRPERGSAGGADGGVGEGVGVAEVDGEGQGGKEQGRYEEEEEEEDDINSYMYQTVGHSIVALYAQALGIPLYRHPIHGHAVNTSTSYAPPPAASPHQQPPSRQTQHSIDPPSSIPTPPDETESLLPLLSTILHNHPTATALSAGAILSTYQRTRIESVAQRLNLVPLAFLWQYPALTWRAGPRALLAHMAAVGMDARIVKVAGGGLDEGLLGKDVLTEGVGRRVEAAVGRFVVGEGVGGGGAVLGEGGEYETVVLDGPRGVWRGRIEVGGEGWEVVKGEGGSAVVRIRGARVVEKEKEKSEGDGDGVERGWLEKLKIPNVLDDEFDTLLRRLRTRDSTRSRGMINHKRDEHHPAPPPWTVRRFGTTITISNMTSPSPSSEAAQQLQAILTRLTTLLQTHATTPSSIIFSTLLLHSMSTFTSLNPIYGAFFTAPNPPARVTVACDAMLPVDALVMLSVVVDTGPAQLRRGLHVQSRSYWAPANIGPYSQATSVAFCDGDTAGEGGTVEGDGARLVYMAGQIPLLPASMEVVNAQNLLTGLKTADADDEVDSFAAHAVLALQHLWRVGRAMEVRWWSAGIAFISAADDRLADERAKRAVEAWEGIYGVLAPETPADEEDEGEDEVDLWELKYGRSNRSDSSQKPIRDWRPPLPDMDNVQLQDPASPRIPPCFVAQVQELPRDAAIEWTSQGLAGCQVQFRTDDCDAELLLYDTLVNGTGVSFLWAGIAAEKQLDALDAALRRLSPDKGMPLAESLTCAVYATSGFPEKWLRAMAAQVIPCRRLWASRGEDLLGVVGIRLQREP